MFRKDCINPAQLIEGPEDLKRSAPLTTCVSKDPEIEDLLLALRATARPAVAEGRNFRRYIPDLLDK